MAEQFDLSQVLSVSDKKPLDTEATRPKQAWLFCSACKHEYIRFPLPLEEANPETLGYLLGLQVEKVKKPIIDHAENCRGELTLCWDWMVTCQVNVPDLYSQQERKV